MQAIIKEQIYVRTKNRLIIRELKAFLDKPNPEYQKKIAMGYSVHATPRRIKMYKEWSEGLIIPRGTGRMARELASRHKELFSIKDERTWGDKIDVDMTGDITPFWYQDAGVKAMTDHQHGLAEAPCLIGETEVNFDRARKGFKISLEKAYEHWKGGRYAWDKSIPTFVRSFDGERIRLNEIDDIVYSGEKECFEITLENGLRLGGTYEHEIMTREGYIPLVSCPGMEVMCDTLHPVASGKSVERRGDLRFTELGYHPMLTCEEHRQVHVDYSNFGQGIPQFSRCVMIKSLGIRKVYDIKCKTEYRNFVANGMVVHNCGAGKTVMGCLFIAEHQRRTLIIVHTLDLFKQWTKEVHHILSGRFTVGMFGGGKKFHGDITVATVQTLVRFNSRDWEYVRQNYSIVLMDEAHHTGAESYMRVMENLQARYIIGLTATPKRADGKNFIVSAYLGSVFYRVTNEDLEMSGRLVPCKVMMAKTGAKYNFSEMGDSHSALASKMAKDVIRNQNIVRRALHDIDEGRVPILLTERVYHAKYLVSLLAINHIEVEEISGHVESDERERIKTRLKEGKIQALVANKQIAAEGLDVPAIDSVHICFWTKNLGLIKQMIGRGRRVFGNKEYCRVWWHYDYIYEITVNDETLEEEVKECPGFRSVRRRVAKWFVDQNFELTNLDVED